MSGLPLGPTDVSEESKQVLLEHASHLRERLAQGSKSYAVPDVTEENVLAYMNEVASYHVFSMWSQDQHRGDQQKRSSTVNADDLPEDFPITTCNKGFKGCTDDTPNQDNFSVTYFQDGYNLACCFDGHGKSGHRHSSQAALALAFFLRRSTHYPSDIPGAFAEAFQLTHRSVIQTGMRDENGFECFTSGTTAVCALWRKGSPKVWTAHVGDSRCMIGSASSRKVLFESMDHKPTVASEVERIESCGGVVKSQYYNESLTTHRIFVQDKDFPGLSMTRSIGDECVKRCGVICEPEVNEVDVDMEADPFMLLCSDGVVEFQSSQVVCKAIAKKIRSEGPEDTLQRLYHESLKHWEIAEDFQYCDDITAILVSLS
eukprot:TRINITY_DN67422_c0_g1_i1.p1 TRINITY_DN67422_c0_g1~~TRINITY_DN67422_c0_g1_i1.p1  ORF type:complete len:396 (+),score=50.54 TRINITY_DN67422_c0_g1_i1:70-1188(+)